jgi:uncharacterized membrane protein YhhN
MNLSLKNYGVVFFSLTLLHLTVLFFEWHMLHLVIKPMFMPVLMLMLYQHTTAKGNSFYRLMQFGLLFSWFGDIALMLDRGNPTYFIVGLLCFLIAHWGYAAAFIGSIKRSRDTFSYGKALLLSIPFIGFTALFFLLLVKADKLGEMLIPVLAYTAVITTMGITATLRHGHTASYNFNLILVGAILFILSDCVIAWNKFVVDFPYDQVLNMSLYLSGQFLLGFGALKYLDTTTNSR